MPTITCPCCGEPMRTFEQPTLLGRTLVMADCRTRGCPLFTVTLTAGDHDKLTPTQIEQYRQTNRRMHPHGTPVT